PDPDVPARFGLGSGPGGITGRGRGRRSGGLHTFGGELVHGWQTSAVAQHGSEGGLSPFPPSKSILHPGPLRPSPPCDDAGSGQNRRRVGRIEVLRDRQSRLGPVKLVNAGREGVGLLDLLSGPFCPLGRQSTYDRKSP